MDKNKERRAYTRFEPAENCWSSVDNSGRSSIKNISCGGVCLLTSEFLYKDSIHTIDIFSDVDTKITLNSRVIWSYDLGVSSISNGVSFYETRFQFVDMDEGTKNSVEKFISHLK